MSNLKCALDILEKNNYISTSCDKKGFYNYWYVEIKIKGNNFIENLYKKLKEKDGVIIIKKWKSNNSYIIFTTKLAITNGLMRNFKNNNNTIWKGPVHYEVYKFLKENKTGIYETNKYGRNDLGLLVEITDIKKKEKKENEEKTIEKEANDLLDKIL